MKSLKLKIIFDLAGYIIVFLITRSASITLVSYYLTQLFSYKINKIKVKSTLKNKK